MNEQFNSDDNFKSYLEGVTLSDHVLGMGIKPTQCQKSFKLKIGIESRVVNFQAANKQFSFFQSH